MIVEVDGVSLHLAHPDELNVTWVGQEEVMRQLLAAWLVIDERDLPMNPRLLGKPGVGKTTLAYAAAQRLDREVYILQATVDTRPEDLLVTPVIEGASHLRYVASPLVTAMLRGGIAILDEGNRMSEKSWASLAPLLDNRRYVESIVAGIKIKAHPLFRLVATMNDDASTFDLPEYIHSRLQPQIMIDFPERHEELAILKENLPFGDDQILNYVTDFLQHAHAADERYSARDGINIARFAMKLGFEEGAGARANWSQATLKAMLQTAIMQTLGMRRCGMSLEAEIKLGGLQRGRLQYFPVVPGRVEFALALRRLLLAERPTVVAVELPGFLEDAYRGAILRLPEMSVILYMAEGERRNLGRPTHDPTRSEDDEGERAVYVPIEPADPFVEALRTALEIGAQVVFLEPDSQERPHLHDACPDSFSIQRIGMDRYVEAYRLWPQSRTDEIAEHAGAMAWKLQGIDPNAKAVVVVSLNLLDPLLDAMETPQDPPARRAANLGEIQLLNPHPDCLVEITVEYPYLQERYEFYRLGMELETEIPEPTTTPIYKPRVQMDLLRGAEAKYVTSTGDKLAYWHRRQIARYTRNLAHMSGDLVAGAYDLTVAARSIVDDNFGWEVWQMANRYLAQHDAAVIETVRLGANEIWLNTKRLRIHRRLPRPKQRLKPMGLKPRKKEKTPGEWAKQTTGNAICSYPPEDLVIEEYGRFLKQKAKALLSEERVRVEPFTTSLLDGIDIRETIRNWYQKKIYVKQADRLAGQVGSVVVIFDEDRGDLRGDAPGERYQYLTTWLGEHQNESDMAFYSTMPFDNIVGPGIGRAEYGGLLMTLPPRRLYDVWSDADYDFAETKAERLLMAGLDYSVERFVVYVAAKPPRSIFRSIAAHLNRKILYVPIGQLSPTKMKRLRVVHVLDGYDRRSEAKDYIW